MLHIKINGTPIQGRIEGLEDFTLNYSRDSETGRTQKSYTNQLKFYDDGFAIIYPLMVANPNGLNQSATVEVWDDCCNAPVYRDLIIRGDMVDFCANDCFVTCRLTRQDPDELIYQCLNKYEISDNRNGYFYYDYNANGSKFPLVTYCNELRPDWLHIVLYNLGSILLFIGYVIWPVIQTLLLAITASLLAICGILRALETILNVIPGFNLDMTPPACDQLFQDPGFMFNGYNQLLDNLAENFIGCGRKHPTPLYRQYVENACQICGINQFNSSILNNPNNEYWNALYFFAPAEKGKRNPTVYTQANRPTAKMSTWLDVIAKDFNARWWISQGQLYFERKDFYLSQPFIYDAVANASTGDILEGVCFTYNENKLNASIKIDCAMDALDDVGNEARLAYVRYEEYTPPNNNFEGMIEKTLSYAPARFFFDPIAETIMRNTSVTGLPFVAILLPNINQYTKALLMAKDTASSPKMLIWDGVNREEAYVKYYGGSGNAPGYPNVPAHVSKKYLPTVSQTFQPVINVPDMYDNFHVIDDPYQNPFRFWNAEFTVRANCQLVQQLDVNRTVRLSTPYGAVVNARINQINANLGERTIQFTCEF
jgi:hypothetical protein